MGMFVNYENILNNYVPNNIIKTFPVGRSYTKLSPVKESKPYEEYDLKGNLIGYSWKQGETLNLEFNIDGEITVESDAIILIGIGEEPPNNEGSIGLRAYNIKDLRSWTCTNIVEGMFVWEEDSEFSYPESGKSIYMTAEDYLKDKKLEFSIYNFRQEPILTELFEGSSKLIVKITRELSQSLKRGIYTCSLDVLTENIRLSIFSSSDCKLLVK